MTVDDTIKIFQRVLETSEVRAVGSAKVRKVDVRLVAASHRDLLELVRQGAFRDDLRYRLEVVADRIVHYQIRIPEQKQRTVAALKRLNYHVISAGDSFNDTAMLAEAIHSLVDTGDSLLLYVGQRRSTKPPDAQHPFGYGKELYFWTLVVALVILSVGRDLGVINDKVFAMMVIMALVTTAMTTPLLDALRSPERGRSDLS